MRLHGAIFQEVVIFMPATIRTRNLNFSQDSHTMGQESNAVPPGYKAAVLATQFYNHDTKNTSVLWWCWTVISQVMMLCSLVNAYQHFEKPITSIYKEEVKIEARD
jgi:hypothetical protein